jgi:formyltetrahydrofolate deformylase
MSATRGQEYVLTLSCPDKPGIVYAVASFLVQHSGNILASQQYGESPDGRFFMRVHFSVPPPGLPLADLERDFSWVAEAFHMSWQLDDQATRVRTLIMVSRLGHCLNDLRTLNNPRSCETRTDRPRFSSNETIHLAP